MLLGGKGAKGGASKRSLFLLYLDAVSVVNQRSANESSKGTDHISQPIDHLPAHQATSFTLRDLHFIVKFAQVIVPWTLQSPSRFTCDCCSCTAMLRITDYDPCEHAKL